MSDRLNLYSRHNNSLTSKFPELQHCPVPDGTILDGEVIETDEHGKPDFEALQSRTSKSSTAVTFCAFDIIKYKGQDVTRLPLMRRKELLEESFIENQFYKKVKMFEGNAIDYFEAVKRMKLEGIVLKKKDSIYEVDKRSWSWQKVINWTYADVYITGIRKKDFGWATSVIGSDGLCRTTGIIEYGVNIEHKKALRSVLKQIMYNEDKNFIHLEPRIKARVKTRNWTKKGMLRSPVFVEFII